ncbi:hypothetical protein GMSM_42730 [Geomonas sp. Red276]
MTVQTLTSLAMLKVDLDQQHRNYVDYVSPFVVDVLNADRPEIICDASIADKLLQHFGLKVPTKAVQHVLRRLHRKSYLEMENGVFTVTTKLPTLSLDQTRSKAMVHIEGVLNGLIEEAKAHNLTWSVDEATRAATAFLGMFTVDCLRTYVFNTALPVVPEKKSVEMYVVSKFITKAQARHDAAFESFIILVKGLMYSNALLCPDLESLEKKFQNLTFYLDTPLLLNAMGLQGPDAKRAADELLTLLKKLKGSLSAFTHTVVETQQVISAAAINFTNPRATGRVIEEARRSGVPLSDLILARDSVDERLRAMGITVKRTPDYTVDYQIDEREFEEILASEVFYKGESALLNDLNSIRSIYVLRQGRQPVRLEDSVAVFVTPNERFAKAAFRAGRNHNSTREISSVITAYSLANIAWLKSPVEAPALPLTETLALCYAALEPPADLFKKYVQEMDRLLESGQITPRDHEILRLSPSARDELMELTLGDEAALTVSNIKSILANLKASILSEQKLVHDAEMEALTKQGVEMLTEAQKRENALAERVAAAEAAAARAEEAAATILKESTRKREARRKWCNRLAHVVTLLLMWIVVATLLLGALAGSGFITAASNASTLEKVAYPTLALIAVIWGVYSWHTGATVRQVASKLEENLALCFDSWLDFKGEPGSGKQREDSQDMKRG